MLCNISKVFFSFISCRCTKTFVILYLIFLNILAFCLSPFFILRYSKELLSFSIRSSFYDWSNEFLNEASNNLYKRGPKMMNEIDDQTLYMGAIMVLISHYHYWSISEWTDSLIVILSINEQAKNFDYVTYFFISNYLMFRSISNIKQFSSQWKDSIVIPSYYLYSTHG